MSLLLGSVAQGQDFFLDDDCGAKALRDATRGDKDIPVRWAQNILGNDDDGPFIQKLVEIKRTKGKVS